MSEVKAKLQMARSDVTAEMIEMYRRDGVVKVPNLITAESADAIRNHALHVATGKTANGDPAYSERLTQQVNVWQRDEILRQLTCSRGIGAIAEQLTGCRLRVWHDHLLSKKPNNRFATEWHQDRPFWPLQAKPATISVWIALQDTPVQKGCMSFIPGSQRLDDLDAQNLSDARSLFALVPELEYEPKVTLPLRAGDATFHNGYTAHMANANETDQWRIAHVTIYMAADATYSGKRHVVTDKYIKEKQHIEVGDCLDGDWFPMPTA